TIEIAKMAVINAGTPSVLRMNQRERTRSRYSRFATVSSLSMAGHPRLDARGADTLKEDLMERGLHQLEAIDARARLNEALQQHLRVRVGRGLALEEFVVGVQLRHELRVARDVIHAVTRAAADRDRDVARARFSFDACDGTIEDLLAARDDA